ncbi:hypothetical protein OG609_42670 [Streptomyces sp. NBC_01224]|nr:hypothetical protein OG609_42670 [Streptomyces sp. NBC_01224]
MIGQFIEAERSGQADDLAVAEVAQLAGVDAQIGMEVGDGHAVGWLRRNRVLLPGVSVLARQVAEVRAIAEKRLHTTVARAARRADAALPGDLVATLKTPEGKRYSYLETLRRPPTRTTGTALKAAL